MFKVLQNLGRQGTRNREGNAWACVSAVARQNHGTQTVAIELSQMDALVASLSGQSAVKFRLFGHWDHTSLHAHLSAPILDDQVAEPLLGPLVKDVEETRRHEAMVASQVVELGLGPTGTSEQ
jgi:hypothetical protein